MSKQLFDIEVFRHISRERHIQSWMWLLDIDGTLLDMAASPSSVEVPSALTASLRQVAMAANQRLALVSGRSLADISKLFPDVPASKSGNHGAEFFDPPDAWQHPTAVRFARQHALVLSLLQPLARDFPGLFLEDKAYSFSVHYRHVSPLQHEALSLALTKLLSPIHHIQVMPAKLCWEVRPDPGTNKGQAVQTLCDRWQNSLPQPSLPVIMGDDRTDEDAFDALPDALTVHVGGGPTHAFYRMENPAAVRNFFSLVSTDLMNRLEP